MIAHLIQNHNPTIQLVSPFIYHLFRNLNIQIPYFGYSLIMAMH